MRLTRLFCSLCLLSASALAHADTFQQFNVSNANLYSAQTYGQTGSRPTAGTLSGGVVIDTTTGVVSSSTLQFTLTSGGTYDFYTVSSQQPTGNSYTASLYGAGSTSLHLSLPGASLVNYTGGDLCQYPAQASCSQYFSNLTISESTFVSLGYGAADEYDASSGRLVSAATPEPSSLLLLSTGALGIAGVLRRRFARQS